MTPVDEPTEAEARVIAAMKAAHPTWTARRYQDGWSVCDGDVPVLAWDPDVLIAWRAAEAAVSYNPAVLRWVRRIEGATTVLPWVAAAAAALLLALSALGFLGWLGAL